MDKNNNKLLIHKNMDSVTLEHSVEIILTPEFYTLIREELDIKFAYQAKQIAQSLFDDYMDTSKEYQYHVSKSGEAWYFYAYDIQEIEDFIESKGIEKHRVSKIYFAQELSLELTQPVKINAQSALQSIDDTVTLLPLRLLNSDIEFKDLDLSSVKLHSGISMGSSHNSLISLKETILLSSIFVILGSIFIVEGKRIKSSISKDDAQLVALLEDNPSYSSTMIRESILEKYKPIDRVERAKRQSIKDISKLLSSKSELSTLRIERSKITADITTLDTNIIKQVTKSSKEKNLKTSITGKNVRVEKSL